ncbi:membrane-bound metal-dependent hydrolase [Halorubrum aidingense JCM 13560]|uniref:Membrane-bound metal-dependent hydrolase n=1 Tax=Halorubrum aidingense JCM 13560 TaxID=1230454 RepID=M0PM79_9EURY|nr:metal-dependent hydrolase [Halorubrum aidingense]EMA69865.1 membrane-bound metal-dependent hydrolase [Halorubrum aidingense JCM 13560]
MYRRGHVGLGLLAYAPVASLTLRSGEPGLALVGVAIAVAFATLPDVDERLPLPHRGPTHTIAFVVAGGGLVGTASVPVVAASGSLPTWTPVFAGVVTAATLGSHLAGDVITPMGIRPFRPLSDAHFTLDVTPAADPRANRLFLGAGVVALALSVGLSVGLPS